jgi:hypothetical protein
MSLPGSAVCSTLVLALTGLSAQAAAQALPANPFVNQKFYVAAGLLDWFSASVDKYDGQIVNAGLSVNYSMTQHFGAGLGYNLFELDIGVDDGDWQGRINSSLNGLYVYLSAYW